MTGTDPAQSSGYYAGPQAVPGATGVMPLPDTSSVGPPAPAAAAPWLPPTVPVHPTAQANGQGEQPTAAQKTVASAPEIAEDADLIEKEWVMGAKQIVNRNRSDPHKQVKELHAFKAEYMKKRYNKIIEPVEE